jgi:hypothetical protein
MAEWNMRISQQSTHSEFTGVQRRMLLLQVWKIYARISFLTLSGTILSPPEEDLPYELVRLNQSMVSFNMDDLDVCTNHITEWYEASIRLLETV